MLVQNHPRCGDNQDVFAIINCYTGHILNSDSSNSPADVPSGQIGNKPKRPMLVTIIFWIAFIQGITTLILSPGILIIGVLSERGARAAPFAVISVVIMGLFQIILSFGLRAMKKWALYTFAVLNILSIVPIVILNISKLGVLGVREIVSMAPSILSVGMAIYLLSIHKKFV